MTDEKLLTLAGLFYDGIVSPDGWQRGLEMLGELSVSPASSLVLWNRTNDRAMVGEQVGLPPELLRDYAAHYHLLDPGREYFDHSEMDAWYLDERDLGSGAIRRSAFYQDFLKSYELDSTMAVRIIGDGHGMDGFLSLSGRPGERDLCAVAARLAPLLPHLRRAASLRLKLLDLSQQLAITTDVLDRFDFPLLVMTASATVVAANRQGENWLATPGNPLAGRVADKDRIATLLSTACGLHGPARAAGMQVKINGTPTYFLTAVPLNEQVASGWQRSERSALLLVDDAARNRIPTADVLRQIFQLTPAEIRLLKPLLQGATLKEAAAQLCISPETARSQLKSIFAKLGVRRQSELQRLLSRLAFVDTG